MTPATLGQGLLSGLGHPIIGIDHFAFLILAALLASMLKGFSRMMVPLAFIAATIAGTVFHLGAANVPMMETLIALTVIVGGVLALTRKSLGVLALGALFALSGLFHGYAYGEAVVGAETTPLLAYLVGFAVIQYSLIVGGILALDKLASRSENARLLAARAGSAVALATGGVFLVLSLT
jgi:urease accessory protein